MYRFAFWLMLAGCASSPDDRVEITLTNRTQRTLHVNGRLYGISRTIELAPGETRCDWVPRWAARRVSVEIRD